VLQDLKKFILRGNVIDLAVAVIIGVAFGAVVSSFVDDVIMALIGALFGEPNLDDLTLDVGDGIVRYGAFLTAVANFLLIAAALFLVVRTAERFFRRREEEEEKKEPTEVELLTEIRDELRARG
jgi:large conductance mechanosensitive channel